MGSCQRAAVPLPHQLQPRRLPSRRLFPAAATRCPPLLSAATALQAAFHTVTAVVGAGVLGLPYAFSYLGWAGGLFTLTLFCAFRWGGGADGSGISCVGCTALRLMLGPATLQGLQGAAGPVPLRTRCPGRPRAATTKPLPTTNLFRSIYTSYLLAAMHEQPNGERLNTYREIGEAVLGEQSKGGWDEAEMPIAPRVRVWLQAALARSHAARLPPPGWPPGAAAAADCGRGRRPQGPGWVAGPWPVCSTR